MTVGFFDHVGKEGVQDGSISGINTGELLDSLHIGKDFGRDQIIAIRLQLAGDQRFSDQRIAVERKFQFFRENIFTEVSKPENRQAAEALVDESYYQLMDEYDSELEKLSRNQINVESVHR